ncbi:hypothetical protein [Streptacidiphilus sp. EB103A]|uniref:hypothetical protein n=1 Tax=Streptacidiphilus sp. EB103A TaxID=3156275 RepID=UPI0035164D09
MTALHPRALAAAGVLSLGALVLSGCSSSSGTATTAQPNSSASGSSQNSAYRNCLAQHGVTLPSGRPGGPGGSARPSGARPSGVRPSGGFGGGFGGASANPSMQAAMQACASVRPSGAAGFGGGGGGFNSTDMAAFTSCMKDHGVTVPATGGTRALNTADPKTAAAYNTCKVLLPTRSGSPSPSPTT